VLVVVDADHNIETRSLKAETDTPSSAEEVRCRCGETLFGDESC
jgi:hypothetical protein